MHYVAILDIRIPYMYGVGTRHYVSHINYMRHGDIQFCPWGHDAGCSTIIHRGVG